MKRVWQVRRQCCPTGDAERRRNQAYQHLLTWTTSSEPVSANLPRLCSSAGGEARHENNGTLRWGIAVPLANCEVTEIMEVAPDPPSSQCDLRMARSLLRRSLISPENTRCAATGECCAPASDRRSSTVCDEAPTATCCRPSPVGLAVPRLEGLAFFAGHCQARNSRWLAPQGISPLLDMENPERQARAAGGPARCPGVADHQKT